MQFKTGFVAAGILALASAVSNPALAAKTGSYTTSFKIAAGYATADTLLGRLLPPMQYQKARLEISSQGFDLKSITVDPRSETWNVYVPSNYSASQAPGLLVWISDDNDGSIPDDFQPVLDQYNMIMISADKSGRAEDLIQRRAALALHGLNGIAHRYKLDGKRIYAGGDGSGALAASRLAFGYPDIFHGTFMLNGKPSIGTSEAPIPAPAQVKLSRNDRFVIVNSHVDNLPAQQAYEKTMEFMCNPNIQTQLKAEPQAREFADGLGMLKSMPVKKPDPKCVANLNADMNDKIAQIRKLLDDKQLLDAADAWKTTYATYGGLLGNDMEKLGKKLSEELAKANKPGLNRDQIYGKAMPAPYKGGG